MKKILNSEGKAQETGLKKALHICRGHFATYGDDAPLFGKHVGTFWKRMHIRGVAKEGMVAKDYKIGEVKPHEDGSSRIQETFANDFELPIKREIPVVTQEKDRGLLQRPRGIWNRLKRRIFPRG